MMRMGDCVGFKQKSSILVEQVGESVFDNLLRTLWHSAEDCAPAVLALHFRSAIPGVVWHKKFFKRRKQEYKRYS